MVASREFDLVLLGPTGYTGTYVAEKICAMFQPSLKWALAGRSAQKIEAVAKNLKLLNADRSTPEFITVQLNKSELDSLAKRTRLIINCVGPYHLFSTPVVEACAQNGTHYVDITGETPWLRKIVPTYHEPAKANGAIIIPSCGFESVPADILTWAVANFVRTKLSADPAETVGSIHEFKHGSAGASGGTLYSIVSTIETINLSELAATYDSYCLAATPRPPTRVTPRKSLTEIVFGVRAVRDLGTLTTAPSGFADETIVNRSSTLMPALYGPAFSFRQYLHVRNAFIGAAFHYALIIGISLLLLPPVRWLVHRFLPGPGQGPTREESANDQAVVRVVMKTTQKGADGKPKRALGTISYQGSQYELSGVAASAAAKVILDHEDEIKQVSGGAGLLTPGSLGQYYVDELEKGGFRLDVKVLEN